MGLREILINQRKDTVFENLVDKNTIRTYEADSISDLYCKKHGGLFVFESFSKILLKGEYHMVKNFLAIEREPTNKRFTLIHQFGERLEVKTSVSLQGFNFEEELYCLGNLVLSYNYDSTINPSRGSFYLESSEEFGPITCDAPKLS